MSPAFARPRQPGVGALSVSAKRISVPAIRKILLGLLAILTVAIVVSAGWLWQVAGAYGFNTVLRRGGTYWIDIKPDDERLSASVQLALRPVIPAVLPGPLVWQEPETGFEVAELPVLADGREVDRILLSRIDPARFRFVTRNAAAGDTGIDE
ncbi:hypothetical protein OS035_00685 [Rhizobium sp. 268]